MKKRIYAVIMAISVFAFSACQTTQVSNSQVNNEEVVIETSTEDNDLDEEKDDIELEVTSSQGITYTDALSREVTINNPERVVTLLGSYCDEWLLAGGNVVGTVSDSFKATDYELDESVVDVGSHMEPDIEKIINLEPDLVFASSMLDSQLELQETFEKAGITVVYMYVNSFDDYLESLRLFTQITGREDLYEEYGTKVALQIEEAKGRIDGRKPTVLFIRSSSTSVKVKGSEGTVGGEILADLDTINIADSESLLEDLSMEAIVLADPDYIFVTTQGSDLEAALANVNEAMINNPAWETLTAVQNGNYYVIDKELYNAKPNERWGEAYEKLAEIIYPAE